MSDTHATSSRTQPEFPGPNTFPTGSRFKTSTEIYAAGGPPTPTVTNSARRVKRIQQLYVVDRLSAQAETKSAELAQVTTRLTEAQLELDRIDADLLARGISLPEKGHYPSTGVVPLSSAIANRE